MRSRAVGLILLTLVLTAFGVHKYYISLTKVYFNESEKAVQITMRFFIDDVENTLEYRYDSELELDTPKEHKRSDFFIEKYLTQKFQVSINGIDRAFQYLGKEYENDVVYFYLEISDVDDIDHITVMSNMLYESFPDQENFIKFDIKSTKKTFILIKDKPKEVLKLT